MSDYRKYVQFEGDNNEKILHRIVKNDSLKCVKCDPIDAECKIGLKYE